MKIYKEISLEAFEPWSGAINTYERLVNHDLLDDFEEVLDETYPDGMSETELNDILWFDPDWVYESVGLMTESELEDKIEELKNYIQDERDEMEEELEDEEDPEERERIIEEHNTAIQELQDELDEYEEEYNIEFC